MKLPVVAALAVLAVDPLAAQDVSLPLERYDNLRVLAQASPPDPPPPAAPWVLEAAEVDVLAGSTSATVEVRLTLTLLAAGWQQIALPSCGNLVAARLGAMEGRLDTSQAGWTLHARGAGRHVIQLSAVVPVKGDPASTRPRRSFRFTPPPAGVVTGTLRVRAGIESSTVEGAVTKPQAGGGWTFAATPGEPVSVTLLGRSLAPERDRLPLSFEARTVSLLHVARTRQELTSWLDVEVRRGTLAELRARLPAGFEVASLRGSGVAAWDVVDRTLVVTAEEPVRGAWSLEAVLVGEARTVIAAPLVEPLGAARVRRFFAVSVTSPDKAMLEKPGSARELEPDEKASLPAPVQHRHPRFVADPAQPPRHQVVLAEGGPGLSAQVSRLVVDVVAGEHGRAAYQLWAEVSSTGQGHLDVTLPAGFEVDSASRDGRPVTVARGKSDGLQVPIGVRPGSQVLHVSGVLPFPAIPEEGTLVVPLPGFTAPITGIEVRLVLPGGRTYELPHAYFSAPDPPEGTATSASGPLVAVLGAARTAMQADTPELHEAPPGTIVAFAAWSALVAQPDPLTIEVSRRKEKASWF